MSAEWIRNMEWPIGEFGARVADLLGELYVGIYHIPTQYLKKVDWENPHFIEIVVDDSQYSTFDFGYLTDLVLLCHRECIRGEVSAARQGLLRLRFHSRQRDGGMSQRHPTMREVLEAAGD